MKTDSLQIKRHFVRPTWLKMLYILYYISPEQFTCIIKTVSEYFQGRLWPTSSLCSISYRNHLLDLQRKLSDRFLYQIQLLAEIG